MQTCYRICLLAVFSVILLTSCNKKNKQGIFIPKNAAIAVVVNGASLSTKLPWDSVKRNALFTEIYNDSSVTAFLKQALDNPENSGIDTKTNLIFFAQKDSTGGIVVFTGKVKDAEKFKVFSLDITKGGSESENAGINFISKSPVCVGWNKEKFVYVINTPELNMQNFNRNYSDSDYTPKARDLNAACKNIFDLKESNSLGENEKFTELVKKSGDMYFWMNSEELNKGILDNPLISMVKLNKLYEGNITTSVLNFENGKILVDVKSYSNKEMTALWKKYSSKDFNEDMVKRLPAKDAPVVFAMSFKPEGIKELMKLMGVDGYANMGLAFAGFSLDDFIKANKGDIVFAITGIKQKNDSITIPGMDNKDRTFENINKQPEVIFATSIGDKEAFNLLIKAGEKFGKNVPAEIPVAYHSDGKYFAIGNSKDNIDNYFKPDTKTDFEFLSKTKGNPFGGYVNIQYILQSFENEAYRDSSAKIIYDASLKFWDKAYMKGGKFEDGGMTQSMEINLVDKNTNSLLQLNQYIGLVAKVAKQRKMQEDKRDILAEGEIIYPPLSALGETKKTK